MRFIRESRVVSIRCADRGLQEIPDVIPTNINVDVIEVTDSCNLEVAIADCLYAKVKRRLTAIVVWQADQ